MEQVYVRVVRFDVWVVRPDGGMRLVAHKVRVRPLSRQAGWKATKSSPVMERVRA